MRAITLAVFALTVWPAAAAAAPGAAAPQAQEATLSTADFPGGATRTAQNDARSAFLPSLAYSSASTSSFADVHFDGARLIALISSVEIAKDETRAASSITAIGAEVSSTAGRQNLVDAFTRGLTAGGSGARTGVIRHRTVRVGDLTVDLEVSISQHGTAVDLGVMFIQMGPAVESLVYLARAPGLRAGASISLAKLAAARIDDASTPPPVNTALPTIAGSAELGQILSAQPGTWTGSRLSYAYQWFRCSATGGACVAIAGSSQPTYTVSTADEGATLAISVVTTNAAGQVIVMSQPTQLVP